MYKLGKEFLQIAEKLQEERNIQKQVLIDAICDAILAAYKRKVPLHNINGLKVSFDEESVAIGIFAPLIVKEKVENPFLEISLEEAKEVLDDVKEDEMLEVEVTPDDFSEYGRIAVQVARQIIRQKLNEEEKRLLYNEYENYKNKVIVAEIERVEDRADGLKDVIVNLGRIEGLMPPKEQIPFHDYKKHERIRVYVSDFQEKNKRAVIIVSQAHEELLLELFRREIPEIDEGIIEIISIARVAGRRAKVAVKSNNPDVDPIGACIGARGSRIQNIISELYTEKIDIIPWSEDPVEFISYALSPTQISEIALFDENKALIIVPDDQLSLAIGKGGQNIKLASKLTGWKLDVRSEKDAKVKR